MTPATLRRLAGNVHNLPDTRRIGVWLEGDVAVELDHSAQDIYDAIPDVLSHAINLHEQATALRRALRLPPDAPWPDVLARAQRWAELYDEDDGATVDEVADNNRSTT